jgi:hypothetical protein
MFLSPNNGIRWRVQTYRSVKHIIGTGELSRGLSLVVDTVSRCPDRKPLRTGLPKKRMPPGKPLDTLT